MGGSKEEGREEMKLGAVEGGVTVGRGGFGHSDGMRF